MSYAGTGQDRISLCQTLRIGALNDLRCVGTQLRTYRSSTINTSCRNTFQNQREYQSRNKECCSHSLPWFTLRRFFGLLFAPTAGGDFCGLTSCPLLGPVCSITSEPTIRGLPSNCDERCSCPDGFRSCLVKSSYAHATWLEISNCFQKEVVYPFVSYLLPKLVSFARPGASGYVVLEGVLHTVVAVAAKGVPLRASWDPRLFPRRPT